MQTPNSDPSLSPRYLDLPGDIDLLIADALLPATELNARRRNTKKHFVEGHPDLFVRLNEGFIISDTEEALREAYRLTDFGINVLPSRIVEHDGKGFVVTKVVDGKPLTDVLAENPSDELIDETDMLYVRLTDYYLDARRNGKIIAADVIGSEQYMWGSISDDEETRLWLVDLPEYIEDPGEDRILASLVLSLCNGLVEDENTAGTVFPKARMAVEEAIATLEGATDFSDAKIYKNTARYVLRHSEVVPDDEMAALPIVE